MHLPHIALRQLATAKSPKSNTSCSASGALRDWQLLHSRPPGWHRARQKRQPYRGRSFPPHNPWPQQPKPIPVITHHHRSPIIAEQLSKIVTKPRTFLKTFHPIILCQSCKQPSPASAKTSKPNRGKSGLLKLEANLLKWGTIDLALVSSSFRIQSFRRIGTPSLKSQSFQSKRIQQSESSSPPLVEFVCHNTHPLKRSPPGEGTFWFDGADFRTYLMKCSKVQVVKAASGKCGGPHGLLVRTQATTGK